MEKISKLLKDDCDDMLLDYIDKHFDEIECEMNGEEYKKPKKHKRNFCIDCNLEMLIDDYQQSILVCTNCGLFNYYPVYVTSYNHPMKPVRRKCIYKRSDNFKVILNQFLCIQNQKVPDEVIRTLWNQINNKDNLLYNFTISLSIPILECLLKKNKLMSYKKSIFYIYFKLMNQPFPYLKIEECNRASRIFTIASRLYDKYKPNGKKSFINYYFTLKKILIVLGKNDYAKYIPLLKTNSKQKELERIWKLITKDPEWVAALQKRKIV